MNSIQHHLIAIALLLAVLPSLGIAQNIPTQSLSQQGKSLPNHCKADEQVVLTCTFKHKKTMSLCASADLTKNSGWLQYRYGFVGKKLELVYPTLDRKSTPNPRVDRGLGGFFLGNKVSRYDINKTAKADPLNPWHSSKQWTTQTPTLGEVKYVSIYFYPLPNDKKVEFQIDVTIASPFSQDEDVSLNIDRSKSGTRLVKEGYTKHIASNICVADTTFENLKMLENDLEGE